MPTRVLGKVNSGKKYFTVKTSVCYGLGCVLVLCCVFSYFWFWSQDVLVQLWMRGGATAREMISIPAPVWGHPTAAPTATTIPPIVPKLRPVAVSKPSSVSAPVKAAPAPALELDSSSMYTWTEDSPMTFPTSFASSDLVLGLAFNMDDKHLAIFASSLRTSQSSATTVLFVNSLDVSAKFMEIITKQRIFCIFVNMASLHPEGVRRYHPSSLRWLLYDRLLHAAVLSKNQIMVSRAETEEALYDPLQAGRPRLRWNDAFAKLLVLDVRDSAFQRDPFALLPPLRNGRAPPIPIPQNVSQLDSGDLKALFTLHAFGEDEYANIASCGWNSGWVRDCFSDNVLNRIGSNPIVCSGVSMGYNPVMVVYVHYMATVLLGRPIKLHTQPDRDLTKYTYLNSADHHNAISNNKVALGEVFSNRRSLDLMTSNQRLPACERNGVDQGIHNVLIYLDVFPAQVVHARGFPVINLQAVLAAPEGIFVVDKSRSAITRPNGELYAVVHQYDRLADYQDLLVRKYVPWVNPNDPMAEWQSSPHCALYGYRQHVDMLRAQCDGPAQRVMTLASCCEVCNGKNADKVIDRKNNYAAGRTICTGFSFVGSVCYLKTCNVNQVKEAVDRVTNRLDANPQLKEPNAISAYLLY